MQAREDGKDTGFRAVSAFVKARVFGRRFCSAPQGARRRLGGGQRPHGQRGVGVLTGLLLVACAAALLAACLPRAATPCFLASRTDLSLARDRGRGPRSGCAAAASACLARGGRVQRRAKSVEGDEFRAARDRIRRIQLGLKPDQALPVEGEEPSEPTPLSPQAPGTDLDLAGVQDLMPASVNVSSDMSFEDAGIEVEVRNQTDAFAGKEKEVEELKPVSLPADSYAKVVDDQGLVQQLVSDLKIISWPSIGEVFTTFAIVMLLVGLYTGFVAVVDITSQKAFSQVFAEWYVAAKPDDSV